MSKYFVFEGCDYTGKTTIANAFVEYLHKRDIKAIYTKEPGSPYSVICQKIRALILDNADEIKNTDTFSYLFAADSYEHMRSVVFENIQQDTVVVSDRSMLSDYAYRPVLRYHKIRDNNLDYFRKLDPIVILLESSERAILRRYHKRNDTNLFEAHYVLDNIKKISDEYNYMLKHDSKNLKLNQVIDIQNEEDILDFDELFDNLIRLI